MRSQGVFRDAEMEQASTLSPDQGFGFKRKRGGQLAVCLARAGGREDDHDWHDSQEAKQERVGELARFWAKACCNPDRREP